MPEQYKILVVDDEPDIRQLLKIVLEKEGYSVIEAQNGELDEMLSSSERENSPCGIGRTILYFIITYQLANLSLFILLYFR